MTTFLNPLQRSLADDWVSLTSRPWVQGPVDAILGNPHLADMMLTHPELELTVDGIISTGNEALMEEFLNWLLADPLQMGSDLGLLVDCVADLQRLERTVLRNDEVMTLQRISIMGKVLAQLSPAMSPENIDAAVRRMRRLLAEGEVTAQDIKRWWTAFDQALTVDVEIIRHYLAVCKTPYKVAQRKVASQAATLALRSSSSIDQGPELQHINLLAPQRLAVGLALLDGMLQIGQHEVAVGPRCELQGGTPATGTQRFDQGRGLSVTDGRTALTAGMVQSAVAGSLENLDCKSLYGGNLVTNMVKLHVSLFKDLLILLWAYHANLALRLGA
eukprot:gene5066-5307_t